MGKGRRFKVGSLEDTSQQGDSGITDSRLNAVCYSEHYVKDISQQVDSGIAA